jgi:hypothetical protein
MTTAVQRLMSLLEAKDRYDIAPADLLPLQVEAAAEKLAQHRESIQLVKHRAESERVSDISAAADIVPLLFAHTAYKSYPESWLSNGQWHLMVKWLDTVSAFRVQGIDTRGVDGIDDWLERLAAKGHYVCCSSGTTGKVSMINSAVADRDIVKKIMITSFEWATGIAANKDRKIFICYPPTNNYRFLDSWDALADGFSEGGMLYKLPVSPLTVGRVREMVALRKSIADGAVRPSEIAAFEALAAKRQQEMDDSVGSLADALIASRNQKLLVTGMYGLLFQVAEAVRAKGYARNDFHGDNAMMVSGGLKGTALPPDYRERILDIFNIPAGNVFNMYSMQEINSFMPRCRAGRFHVPPWLMLLPLDQSGETLLEIGSGEIEARAAFFDFSIEGRWGGIISGDRVRVDFGSCACGHQGPTIADDIVRYSDLPGGDKISCAGTIDAYVRGIA